MTTQTRKFMVVATEPTPNPAAFKFNLNSRAIAHGVKAFNDDIEAGIENRRERRDAGSRP